MQAGLREGRQGALVSSAQMLSTKVGEERHERPLLRVKNNLFMMKTCSTDTEYNQLFSVMQVIPKTNRTKIRMNFALAC